ncbi:MAG TPA: hydroxysqualene dehydroxylase HpnE [Candidatus Sulfotelmatobacter sp.]|nr:hydroxysqualene dehydroxylase HpnE [Candidatus Sulfotelmatobacter sp.]
MPSTPSQPTVAVAGGGLAGLATACALSDAGFRVTLFEKRPFLGGRASSYEHPGTGEVVDNCQHVLFRSCTNLIEFYHRIGVVDQIRWFDQMNFIEPGGRISVMKSSFLPAPLHTAPSFFNFSFLRVADKLSIARALAPLTLTQQRDTGQSFQHWLDRHGQTEHAVTRFWRPILVSALSEELDRISISAAAQVVRESMKSPAARQMGVPTVPLTNLYNAAGDYVRTRGGVLHFRRPVEGFVSESSQVRVGLSDAEEPFDFLVVALPFEALDRLLPDRAESNPLREQLSHFETSPITGIHMWFDRQISDLDHAVLLDRTVQWMFHKSRLQPIRTQATNGTGSGAAGGSYIELVVSSSKTLIDRSRAEIVDLALTEVREFFPASREASLVKATVIKEVNATYSPRPGIDAYRPGPVTPWPRVFLAGDWTATGWPATMEGAVRSGHLAAEALARGAGHEAQFLSPDLTATGFMRIFS